MRLSHHECASADMDKVVSQETFGCDALAAFLTPLDAFKSRGKDDCLRAPPPCARVRVSIHLGSSKVCRNLLVTTSTFWLVSRTTCWQQKGQCTSSERRKAMLAGARLLTCAAVRAEIQTCIRQLVRAWPLEPTSGRGGVYSRFSEIAGRSPRELVGDSEDAFATGIKVRNTRAATKT